MGARGLAVEVTRLQVHSLILGRIGTALPPGQENETKRYESWLVACIRTMLSGPFLAEAHRVITRRRVETSKRIADASPDRGRGGTANAPDSVES